MTVIDVEAFAEPAVWALVDPVITLPIPAWPAASRSTRGARRGAETPADLAGSAYTRRVCAFDRDGLEVPVRTSSRLVPTSHGCKQ